MTDNSSFMDAFKGGDNKAFQQIVIEYTKSLKTFAENLIKNSEEAEDIVSETFYKLYLRRNKFNSEDNIRAFLYIVVRNSCLNFIKQENRKKKYFKDYIYLNNSLTEEDIIREAVDAELLRRLPDLIAGLSPISKQVMTLKLQGKSNQEIAAELGSTPRNVASIVYNVLDKIRKMIFFILIWLFF